MNRSHRTHPIRRTRLVAGLSCAALVFAACGGDDDSPTPADSPGVTTLDDDSMDDMGDADALDDMTESMDDMTESTDGMDESMDGMDESMDDMDESGDPMIELAAWQTIEIVDVDGESFRLADYVGTPLLVEPFATWCSNCRSQLRSTQEAAAALGDEAAVVALSVETDLSPGNVARYASDNGFGDIRFAVMSPELLAALVDAFGNSVANPPATPKLIVDAEGTPGALHTGTSSSDSLVTDLRAAA